MQPQEKVTNNELCEAISLLIQVVTNNLRQQRGDRQDRADTMRIREFLIMNPPSFTGSSTTEDLENICGIVEKGI